ncbi:MAG TPA: dephospho-CoA kinase [Bacteroidales bacterium]|nr:dephospho-CoA kinase [Bacteroidales bacterium]
MRKIGVTGGIGSGKSLICKVFSRFGIPVYYADDEAKILSDTHPEIRNTLISWFGNEIYAGDVLNRPMLADIIFKDREWLSRVNGLIHPRVAEHFKSWCLKFQGSPYIIHESAILFESGAWMNFDAIIGVTATESTRLKRVMNRPQMSPGKFRMIMQNQLPDNELAERCNHIIVNDDHTLVIPQVMKLHKTFISD